MKNDNIIKRIFKSFHTMKFGIILLIVIALVSLIGTVIPQGNDPSFYRQGYSPLMAEVILAFNFDNLFFSKWYIFLTGLLLVNLFLCSINRARPIIKASFKDPEISKKIKNVDKFTEIKKESDDEKLFKDLGFGSYKEEEIDGKKIRYKFSNKIGHLGSWLTHLSIIIIILAFGCGRYLGFDEYIYGVPGETLELENSDYQIKIDNYNVLFREDFTVEQYITDMSILDKVGKSVKEGTSMVNHPLRFDKFSVYQNSTGWAVDALLFKDKKSYKEKILYNSEVFVEDDKKIALQLVDFYPDFDSTNPTKPKTSSPFLKHPVALYALFYDGERVDMGLNHVGDPIEWEEYTFVLENPRMFTLLQVADDPGTPFALVGGIILLIGLFLAFYMNPKEMIIIEEGHRKSLFVNQAKNDKIFESKIEKTLEELEIR